MRGVMRRSDTPAATDGAEDRLLLVLLANALHRIGGDRRSAAARHAKDWVCAPEDGDRFSFVRACERLGVEARPLRRRLGLRAQVPRRRSRRGLVRDPR
jgi:hypothetical protein